MDKEVPRQAVLRSQTIDVGFSAFTTILVVALPKCPLCWMALMSALGVSSMISSGWLQPLAIGLLLLSVGALLFRARRWRSYGPFLLGLASAFGVYFCKFRLNYDLGVYLSATALLAASVWNAMPKRKVSDHTQCHC